jgi:hypothetical protein
VKNIKTSTINRFKKSNNYLVLIKKCQFELYKESGKRNYQFDVSKIKYLGEDSKETIKVTNMKIEYDFELIKWKVENRNRMKLD